jgi:hypothetical protein
VLQERVKARTASNTKVVDGPVVRWGGLGATSGMVSSTRTDPDPTPSPLLEALPSSTIPVPSRSYEKLQKQDAQC